MCEQAEVDERFRKKVRSNKSKGICSVDKTLFVTDVSAGEVKIVTRLGETISFLKILGSLYDTFGIHSRDMKLFIETS